MATKEEEYKRLRSFLNKQIRGKNTDAILRAAALGPVHLINNVEAVNDSLYIVSAQERYLDERLGDKGVVRPPTVGLSDDVFREIGIEITNRKLLRDLVHQLLRILYGDIFTRATSLSQEVENYSLEDGDNLIVSFDGAEPVNIVFSNSQFQNISSATAQEVADAITKSLRNLSATGAAFAQEVGNDIKVTLISSTDGPSSSVQVLGGSAQNALKFDTIVPTSADATTQWALTQEAGGAIRATWTGGADPSLGKVNPGDYVNIFGTAFNLLNRGTFTVTEAIGGLVNESYVEFVNPNGIFTGTSSCSGGLGGERNPTECFLNGGSWNSSVVQGTAEAILFFTPTINLLQSNDRYAAGFQTSPRTLEVFMPATTKVVRRDRSGAAHIYESGASITDQTGPYVYDLSRGFTVGDQYALTIEELDGNSDSILLLDDATQFTDGQGLLMFGLGTSHQEGPVPYVSRPSDQTIRLDPAYQFKNVHPAGTDVALLESNSPVNITKNGADFPFYATDSVAGRIYAEDLIREITATGIVVVIFILYPNDIGLGKWGDPVNSEKFFVWGTEEELIE